MNKRTLVLAVVGVLLVSLRIALPAEAIVPAFVWPIWGLFVGVTGVAIVTQDTDQEQERGAKLREPNAAEETQMAASKTEQNVGP